MTPPTFKEMIEEAITEICKVSLCPPGPIEIHYWISEKYGGQSVAGGGSDLIKVILESGLIDSKIYDFDLNKDNV